MLAEQTKHVFADATEKECEDEQGVHPRPFNEIRFPLTATLFTSAVFAVTAWFAKATFTTHALKTAFNIDVGGTLTVLRILQGVLSGCTTYVVLSAFQLLKWSLVAREGGVNGLTVLALSPTTSTYGTLAILFASKPRAMDRLWALARVLLVLAIWLAGVLLFVKTSLATSYSPIFSYNVTAGVGQFNASSVPEHLSYLRNLAPTYNKTVVPYSIYSIVQGLVVNKMHSIASPSVVCRERACDSYLFTGGLIMTTPLQPTNYSSYPIIQVYHAPAIQLEFSRHVEGDDDFTSADCSVFGAAPYLIAVRLCVGRSRTIPGAISAGLYVCPDGIKEGTCISNSGHYPNLTTTFSVYSRTASVIASRSNYSIISVSDLTLATRISDTNITALRQAMGWLLDYNSAGIPATSSIAQLFWSSPIQVDNDLWSMESYQVFKSILAFPFWHFNPNNYGNSGLKTNEVVSNLPEEFYTTAAIVSSNVRIEVNKGMFVAFVVLEGSVLVFVWLVLLTTWGVAKRLPYISSYPVLDFSFKTQFEYWDSRGDGEDVRRSPPNNSSDSTVRSRASRLRVRLRSSEIVDTNCGDRGKTCE